MFDKSRPWFSQRTRNVLGAVALILAMVAAAVVVRNGMERAALAQAEAQATELVLWAAQADASDALLRRHPERYADALTPGLQAILARSQQRYQALYDEGRLRMAVLQAGPPVRQDVDAGEGKALYRVEMMVDVHAHPTMAPGQHLAHTDILLHRDGDTWRVSQINTVIK